MKSRVFIAVLFATSIARAQETSHGGIPGDDLVGGHEDAPADTMVDPGMKRSWNEGAVRPFAAVTIDAGYLYLRPRLSVGYGKPFGTWLGIDLNPLVVSTGYGAYGGARFQIPYADLRVGARYFSAFQHAYLPAQGTYDRLDLDNTELAKAKYLTLETELTLAVPIGPGDLIGLGSLSAVEGVPTGSYVFEETLHVMVAPPIVWRARAGYAIRVGKHDQHSIGFVADFLDIPKRDDSKTVRVGPVLRIVLSRHFDVRGSFVMTVVSPDRLGLVGGDFTELGVRYRTATE